MKRSQLKNICLVGFAAWWAGGIGCPRAVAAWGSIRANNRSTPAVRAFQGHEGEARRNAGRPEENRRGIDAGHREAIEHEARESRRLDIGRERANSYYWSGYRPGIVISALPPGSVPLQVGANPYYYYQGVYYEGSPSGYVAVAPPPAAVVSDLPLGAEAIAAGPNVYYYAGGCFYVQQPQGGFAVVAPPLGVTVNALPGGAVPVTIHGELCYKADGAYFLPVMEGGATVYTTVQP